MFGWRKRLIPAVAFLFALLLLLGLAEVSLRILDWSGLIALSPHGNNLARYRIDWHHDRGPSLPEIDDWTLPVGCTSPEITVLIGGDSWMRERYFGEALLQRIHEGRSCVRVVNTGAGSFSPSLIQLRLQYVTKNITPTIIVISIDETDLMDEWVRYRHSLIFDVRGDLVAVPPFLPDLHEMIYYAAIDVTAGSRWYMWRLLNRAFVHGIFVPQVREHLNERGLLASYTSIMAPQRSIDAWTEFTEPIAWFERRLESLLDMLERVTPEAIPVLVTHPHYLHVAGPDELRYRFSVSDLVRRVATRRSVLHLPAASSFKEIHPVDVDEVFQWPRDPFSHLKPEAARRYGTWVGERLATLSLEPKR